MKKNKILFWIGAVILVVLIIVVSEKLSNRAPSETSIKFFPNATEKTISSIAIMDAQDTVKLKKKGDIWIISTEAAAKSSLVKETMTGSGMGITPVIDTGKPGLAPLSVMKEFPVDSASIAIALEKLSGMKQEVEISENTAKQSLFEVDSVKGTYVEAFDVDGKSLGAVRIGKNGADWSSYFVRAIGSNKVYSVGGSIRTTFFTDKKRWRDKNILKFARTSAKNITIIKKDGTTISLAKASDTGSTWNLVSPVNAPAKTDQVDDVLNKFSFFTAADFEDTPLPDSVTGFNAPELMVNVELGGAMKKIIVGHQKPGTKNFWVKTDGKDQVYLVC